MTSAIQAPNDQIAKRNVLILIVIQAFIGAMVPAHFLLGGLAGKMLTNHVALATLPISSTIIGGMIAAPILSRIMVKSGRINGFVIATLIATIGLVLSGLSITYGNFWLLCLGALLIGFYMAAQGFFRFASTDMASAEFRPRAISFTLIGGLISAFIGPTIAGKYSVPNMALPYFIMAVVAIFTTALYFALQLPKPKSGQKHTPVPLGSILRNRQVIAAMVIAISAYVIMNLMMTSTPLAVEGCGYSRADSSSIVRAHVLAMFAPSFFTGYLIKWFGLRNVVISGILILVGASIIALMGIELSNFYIALILLGIGWNFAYIGGTAMLTGAITDPDAAKTLQGVNDTILWSCVALGSLSSGVLMNYFGDGGEQGWHLVNYAMLPILAVSLIIGWVLSRPQD